jgi:hypothetical protein
MALNPTGSWFSPTVQYEGYGRAEFSRPRGQIKGPVRIAFSDSGDSHITMEVAEFDPEKPPHFGMIEFLHGGEQSVTAEGRVLNLALENNPCTLFEIETQQGTFTATSIIEYDYSDAPVASGDGKALMTLYPLCSRFDAAGSGPARYWVIPLVNFVSDFHGHDSLLSKHPLRIWREPTIPDELTEERAQVDRFIAKQKDQLILFGSKDHPGFLEPLPDYEDRVSRLLRGTDTSLITAVAVGEIGDGIIDPYEDHFPLNVLRVLGFATGTEVGTTWIEFRDATGAVVRRSHARYKESRFSEGRAPIKESVHRGTGKLLNSFFHLPKVLRDRLRPAMNYSTQSGLSSRTTEDKLKQLFLGLDGLCEFHDLSTQHLSRLLDETNRNLVKQALREAARTIKEAASKAADSNDFEQSRILQKIAERTTATPASKNRDFGLAVVDLAKKFGFPDAEIIDRYYQAHPRDDRRMWHQLVSRYRGRVTHVGPLEFPKGEVDIEEAITMLRHLHDLFTRVILKMLDYNGTYNPWTTDYLDKVEVDWVKSNTNPSKLGYGKGR